MMRRGNKYLTPRAKCTLYYGQVHSNLCYGISIWGPMLRKGQINEILAVQRKCVNLIGGHDPFVKFYIPTVHELIIIEQCKLGYKPCNGLLPVGFESVMLTDHNQCSIEKKHTYPTRSTNVPNHPGAKLNLYRSSFLYTSIKNYSELPTDVRESRNVKIFSKKCKKYVLSP